MRALEIFEGLCSQEHDLDVRAILLNGFTSKALGECQRTLALSELAWRLDESSALAVVDQEEKLHTIESRAAQ